MKNLVEISVNRGDGFKLTHITHNLRTNDGIDYAARQLGGAASNVAVYMALAQSTFSPNVNHRSLGSTNQGDTTNEFTGNGLARAAATYAHTSGITSYTLTRVFTYSGGSQVTVYGVGEFTSILPSGSVMFLEAVMGTPQQLNTNDQIQVIHTVQI